jgi:hypothetical protein
MIIIKNNFIKNNMFPKTEICKYCNSEILLEREDDCKYQPESTGEFYDKAECYIWECPCCCRSNYIYL